MQKLLTSILLITLIACERQLPEPQAFPILRTLEVSNLDGSGASFKAEILRHGSTETTSYGFIWSTVDPKINSSSSKVVIGEKLVGESFEKRIDYSIAEGMGYYMRAFATYGDNVVYGNIVTFNGMGSNKSQWKRLVTEVALSEGSEPYGSAFGENGFVLFHDANFFIFDPVAVSFSRARNFPLHASLGMRYLATSHNNAQLWFATMNGNIYRFGNGEWSLYGNWPLFGNWPYNYNSYGMFHLHKSLDKIFVLNPRLSWQYDPVIPEWVVKSRIPDESDPLTSVSGASLGEKAYILNSDKRLWEYDVTTDRWIHKSVFPGELRDRIVSFAHAGKIYFGLAYFDLHDDDWMDNRFWSYDPSLDKWELQELFPAFFEPGYVFYFTIKGKLYIGIGFEDYSIWQFDPVN